MPAAVAALLFALGGAAWIYAKVMRSSGNNTQHALIVAGASGIVMFLFFFMVLRMIESALN